MCIRLTSALALALLVPVAGCDNTFIAVNTDGLIVVAVSTNGVDTDSDGLNDAVFLRRKRRMGRRTGEADDEECGEEQRDASHLTLSRTRLGR